MGVRLQPLKYFYHRFLFIAIVRKTKAPRQARFGAGAK
jgi:hypothetical protein